jgi:hypothetical protein
MRKEKKFNKSLVKKDPNPLNALKFEKKFSKQRMSTVSMQTKDFNLLEQVKGDVASIIEKLEKSENVDLSNAKAKYEDAAKILQNLLS